jgi:hypothetical protein
VPLKGLGAMHRLLQTSAFTLVLMGFAAGSAHAQVMGPYCFQPSPFSDLFVFMFTPNGANHLSGTGRNVATGAAMTATAILTGATAILSFNSIIPPTGSGHSFMGTANLSLATGSGPGRCETLNTTGGCGLGTAMTMTMTTCPAGALTDPPFPETVLAGKRLMDGSSEPR